MHATETPCIGALCHDGWTLLTALTLALQVEKAINVTITGYNKETVGQFAASIRAKRPPEPYKQKGVRYLGEYIRKKEGKRGK